MALVVVTLARIKPNIMRTKPTDAKENERELNILNNPYRINRTETPPISMALSKLIC